MNTMTDDLQSFKKPTVSSKWTENFLKWSRHKNGKGKKNFENKVVRYQGRAFFIPRERVIRFFSCTLYLCLIDKIDYDKISHEEDYISFFYRKFKIKTRSDSV